MKRHWWARLALYALPHAREVALTLFLTLVLVALNTLKPWPMKLMVDYVLTRQPLPPAAQWIAGLPGAGSGVGMLIWLIAGTVVLFIAVCFCWMALSYVKAGLGARITYRLGAELFDHLQRLSLRFHGRRAAGDLVQRVTADSGCVRELIIDFYMPLLTSLLSLLAIFALLWKLDPMISFMVLLAVPALGILIPRLSKPMEDRRYENSTKEGELLAQADRTLTALPMVQAFAGESYEDTRFRNISEQTIRTYLRMIVAQIRFQIATTSVTALGTASVLVFGGLHVVEGRLSIGSLLVLLSYVSSIYEPIERLAWLSSGFASAGGQARRVLEILDVEHEVRDAPHAQPYHLPDDKKPGHVRLEQVTFGYEPQRPVLRDISLDVQPGEVVALVGATGAGKSTLAGLIMRFYDPERGRITLDGNDLRDLQLSSLRAQFAIVLQDPFILPMSVSDNIAYGRPGATQDQVIEAARAANAHPFIKALPQGYDTVVGERGATLSGGERQRIAIARALLKDALILILDEPTSSLDSQTESQIMGALKRLMKGRTTFIIAHRFSTIREADRIVVVEQGRIVQQGRHDDLIRVDGTYRRLYESQGAAAKQTPRRSVHA